MFAACQSHLLLSGASLNSRQSLRRASRTRLRPSAELRNYDWPQALLFDCDGVLADTERDGHRVTFNAAFAAKGLHCSWSVKEYESLLKTGGGKERMLRYFTERGAENAAFAALGSDEERWAFVADLHALKTRLFVELVERGELPLRPGVAMLVDEAREAGVPIAVCSTSNEQSVSGIVRTMLGPDVARVMRVFAGDCVPKKKPAPDIYLLAARELKVDPKRCVVVEDQPSIAWSLSLSATINSPIASQPSQLEQYNSSMRNIHQCCWALRKKWMHGVSPEAKWPGVRRAGQAALLAVHRASSSDDDDRGDNEV